MIPFFLFISVANLTLGYFVAWKYHRVLFPEPVRERELVRPRAELRSEPAPFTIDASKLPLITRESSLTTETATPTDPQLAETTLQSEVLVAEPPHSPFIPTDSNSAGTESAGTEELEFNPQSDEASPLPSAVQPKTADESADTTSTASEPEQIVESGSNAMADEEQHEKGEIAVSLDDFMSGLMEFRSQLSNLDQRVRKCAKDPESREIEDCLKEFRVANSLYLEQTAEASDRLQQQTNEIENQSEVCSAVRQALDSQAAEVRKQDEELSQLDVSADVKASCEMLLKTANELNTSSDKLSEEIHSAQREFNPEPTEDDSNTDQLTDPMTQIPSRYKFELELRRQNQSGDAYCIGLVDVDRCGELNLKHGQQTVDGVINSLAQIVTASARKEVCAARYSGQQFAILFSGQEPAEAAFSAETVRQIVERTTFQCEEVPVEVTVSMVLIACSGTDTLMSIEQRLRTAVAAGKSFGRNRTFQFQDGDVEPILPPDLEIKSNLCEVKP